MDLDSLRMFITVAEKGSFISAARQLGVSQPTLSRKIKLLEEQLNLKLLHRGNRELSLTPQGTKILDSSLAVVQAWEKGLESLEKHEDEVKGTLRLGLLHPMARWLTESFISNFLHRYPNIQLDLVTLTPKQLLSMPDCDLMISPIMPDDQSLVAIKIFDCNFCCYASPDYLNKFGIPSNPLQLTQHSCIANINCPNAEKNWPYIDIDGEEKSVDISGRVTSDSMDIARLLAANGLGIALLPELQVTELVREHKLVQLLSDYKFKRVDMNIIVRSRDHMTNRVKVFIDAYKAFLTELRGIQY
ncbi:LysR family transcriptional regulator [Enterovibrio sp. ZSDZ35]|uniref:LysR family transcriptional regulator n=1 Tax=Enterovibrio qingdaonensis TaxID=2899818 RepID=A0ABT5QL97_9GAMM|nr:LysR family transcriptional regulator [Enterovibrio sp. ZSDZ35]MDD1781081.1 LysR family transcriptional regulator [Enterovibrio sp. ZSDZ35]